MNGRLLRRYGVGSFDYVCQSESPCGVFCCLLLDTYLDDSVSVNSIFKEIPADADDIRWLYHQRPDGTRDAHPYGIGFNLIKSADRRRVTVDRNKVRNWGVGGGRCMDADRVAPNGDKDYTWEF